MRIPILYDFIRPKEKLFKGDSAADLRLKEERTITTRRYFKLREEAGRGGGGREMAATICLGSCCGSSRNGA